MLPEVRMARILNAIVSHKAKKLSCVAAGELLGMSERHFRRLLQRYDEDGPEGLIDRRRGRVSGRRAALDEVDWVTGEYRDRYFDFGVKQFHECVSGQKMANGQAFSRSYTWTKSVLQLRGLTTKAKARGVHRRKRERKALPGMMLLQDGSRHAWLPFGPALDLIATIDDATGAILSLFLVEEEGTASTFRSLREVIDAHGLFSSLYTDRGSHYFSTPKAGEPVDKAQLTQVGRALKQLQITHIPSYSPQARGRIERLWDTLQKRLPPLLRLQGVTSIEAANRWLRESYMPEHNQRFAVEAAAEGTAFVAFAGDLGNILCIQNERVVSNDNTLRYNGLTLQIPKAADRCHYVQATVRVHEYPCGTLALFHGPRQIASFAPKPQEPLVTAA